MCQFRRDIWSKGLMNSPEVMASGRATTAPRSDAPYNTSTQDNPAVPHLANTFPLMS